MTNERSTQTGESSLSQRQKQPFCAGRRDHRRRRRRRRNKWKRIDLFRAIGRHGKWKESTPISGRRCGARRATDCLRQFHAFPYPPPPVIHYHLQVHPHHLGQPPPFLNAPFSRRPPAQTPQPCSSPFARRIRGQYFGRSPGSQFRSSFRRGPRPGSFPTLLMVLAKTSSLDSTS